MTNNTNPNTNADNKLSMNSKHGIMAVAKQKPNTIVNALSQPMQITQTNHD